MVSRYGGAGGVEVVEKFEKLLRRYHKDDVAEFAQNYPTTTTFTLSWTDDLFTFDPDLADDFLSNPEDVIECANEALRHFDVAVDISMSQAEVAVNDLHDDDIYGIEALRAKHGNQYVGVHGVISRVSSVYPRIKDAAFECQRCGSLTYIPQEGSGFTEPHNCQGCERQGPFEINFQQSEFVDSQKIQLQQPPESASDGPGQKINVFLEGDLIQKPDSDQTPLSERIGEEAIVYGIVGLEQQGGKQNKKSVFDQHIDAHALEFEMADDGVDVDEHKAEFQQVANGDNPVRQYADSIAPDIEPVGNWPLALLLGTAYLFGGVRVDRPDGSTHRGDIHVLAIGDPGLAKSLFAEKIAEISPDAEHRSVTGMASEVGLIAAAVQDDFSEGDGWNLRAGVLARAGDHAIVEELDKAEFDLTKINEALEGRQMAPIDKGGIKAKLKTRVGLFGTANPKDGRFDPDAGTLKDQIDLRPSIYSRFDGIVILIDQQDEEDDKAVADTILSVYREDAAREKAEREGDDPEAIERKASARPVSKDTLKAWVKYARENVFPTLTDEAHEKLKEFYVDVRSEGNDYAPAANPRDLRAGIRFSTAFARCRLSETVEEVDAELAIELSKKLIGQTFDSEYGFEGDMFTEATPKSQRDRVKAIKQLFRRADDGEEFTAQEVADETGVPLEKTEYRLEQFKHDGLVKEPRLDGNYVWLGK